MSKSNLSFLENKDIIYELIPLEEIKKELKNETFTKLSDKAFEKLDMVLQSIPGQLANKIAENANAKIVEEVSKGAYKVILKDGMHLAKSKALKGAYRGLVYDSNNNLVTHADLIPVSLDGSVVAQAPQLALGVFNAMSIATGQYFLSQINSKIEELETGLSDIMDYLQAEKRSEIMANDITIMKLYNNLDYILNNDFERQTISANLKQIKRDSLSNMLLLKTRIEATKDKLNLTTKSKAEDLTEVFAELNRDIPQYWCAIRSYSNSAVLDTIIAEMDAAEYIDSIKNDLQEVAMQYQATLDGVDNKIQLFIEKAKDFNKTKKIPNVIKSVVDCVPAANLIGAGIKVLAIGAIEIDEHIEKASKEKKKKAISEHEAFWEACKNLESFEECTKLLDEYKVNRNSQVELICTDDEAYIKYGDLKVI